MAAGIATSEELDELEAMCAKKYSGNCKVEKLRKRVSGLLCKTSEQREQAWPC